MSSDVVDSTGVHQWHKRGGRSPAPATPMPAERGKSEDKEPDNSDTVQQPKFDNETEIRDIFDTIRVMQADLKTPPRPHTQTLTLTLRKCALN